MDSLKDDMEVSSQNTESVVSLLRKAVLHHQSGQLKSAREIYVRLTRIDPKNSKCWYLLGCVHQQLQDSESAEASLREAISLNPACEQYHHNLATILQIQQKTEDAIKSYQKALIVNPNYLKSIHGLATAYHRSGQLEAALNYFDRVIDKNPEHSGARFNRAILLFERRQYIEVIGILTELLETDPHTLGIKLYLGKSNLALKQYEDAIYYFKEHMKSDPGSFPAMLGLGEALLKTEDYRQAIDYFKKLISLKDCYPEVHNNIAICYQSLREMQLAHQHYLRAIDMEPKNSVFHNNYGTLLLLMDQHNDAIKSFHEALGLRPKYFEAMVNLGNAYMNAKLLNKAEKLFNEVLKENANSAYAMWHRAMLRLLKGNFPEGFQDYEVRENCNFLKLEKRVFSVPRWRGGNRPDATILVYCEQGFGDSIQFSRFLKPLEQKFRAVYLECPVSLARIFESIMPKDRVFIRGQGLPKFDYTCPLHSLPLYLKTTVGDIPSSKKPYLHAPTPPPLSEDATRLLEKLETNPNYLVGIVWAGNPLQTNDIRRSCSLDHFLKLKQLEGVQLISIQNESTVRENDLLIENDIPFLGIHATDFGDTALILNRLDLLITVDTAAGHLSGALGLQTWILLSYAADWRWMENREDSPWYPFVRLFRQSSPGNWFSVFQQIEKALGEIINKSPAVK